MAGRYQPRKPWSQPLADLVAPCLKPALSRFGFDEADLLVFWPEIVGERLAARCDPVRIQWPPRPMRGGAAEAATLIVRVEGAFAIELQHQAAVVVDRVNAHLGWRCIGRLAFRQGPALPRPAGRHAVPPPSAAAVDEARHTAAGIQDASLQAALIRLGSRVLGPRET